MKIAYLAHIRFPSERAHSIQIVHMANAFAAEGHEVELFVNTRSTTIAETPEEYYGMRFLFTLTRVPIVDIIARVHSFPKVLHWLLFNVERFLFLLSFVWHHRARNFDLIYCRDECILGCLSFLYPARKIVWESHEGKDNFFARRLLRRVHVVVISEGIKEQYLSLGFDGEHITVAHDAIDDSFFSVQRDRVGSRLRIGISTQKPVVMYIGGLDAWKGVHTFFETAVRMPQIQMVVIGGSDKEIALLRVQYPLVQFLGARPYRELPLNQQAADILVVPNTAKNTLSSSYTSPLKLFAHMTARIPLIVSDIPSLRAVVDDSAVSFFSPDDSQSLAHAISKVLQSPEDSQKKASVAYEKSKQHTWRKRAERVLAHLMVNKEPR